MGIKNFGQALEFAIRFENAGVDAYDQAAEIEPNETIKNLFIEFSTANKNRRKLLRTIYNENVNSDMDTGILAPVETMDEKNYSLQVNGPTQSIQNMEALEQSMELFYKDLLKRLHDSPRSIIRRIKKLSEENATRRLKLKDHFVL